MNTPNQPHDSQGIWIPRAIWLLRGLSLREKALLAEIRAHDPAQDYYPSNQTLTAILDIGERQVRACLAALRAKGFITIRLNAENQRLIRLTGKHAVPAKRQSPSVEGKPPKRTPARRKQASTRAR